MRAVVQRVAEASVTVADDLVARIDHGLLVLLAVATGDGEHEATWMIRKIAGLRIFADDAGAMNLDVGQVEGSVLVVSQFTLLGEASRGNRPSFVAAAAPEVASTLCDRVVEGLRARGLEVASGRFRAHMLVRSVNDGPVTIILDRPAIGNGGVGADGPA
jgi:D-tyrosyl-tRNA(Tyr) deacylase